MTIVLSIHSIIIVLAAICVDPSGVVVSSVIHIGQCPNVVVYLSTYRSRQANPPCPNEHLLPK